MNGLDKKVVVVTGGGSGIGRGITKRLASEGAKVVIVGRRERIFERNSIVGCEY